MAAFDLEEQERIDAIKDWWRRYGVWVYVGVGALVAVVVGHEAWQYYKGKQAAEASSAFDSFERTAKDGEAKQVAEAAKALTERAPKSAFASLAQLKAAQKLFEAGDLDGAAAALAWVGENGAPALRPIGRLRLATVQLDQKKYDEAFATLAKIKDAAYASQVEDLRGDLHTAQGKPDDARRAYQTALDKAGQRNPARAAIQAKLDALGS